MPIRVLYVLILCGLVLWAPWWLAAICGLAGIVRYKNFYELIIPALIFDFIYSATGATPVGFPLFVSFFALVLVYLIGGLKEVLIFDRVNFK